MKSFTCFIHFNRAFASFSFPLKMKMKIKKGYRGRERESENAHHDLSVKALIEYDME